MQRLVKYADELVTGVGPRPGGSKGEHKAAELIAANLEDLGMDTWIQEFSTARSTAWVRLLYYVLAIVAAELLFILPDMTTLAFILALLAGGMLALDLLGKSPLYKLFNKGLSQNVVARYVPEGADPRRKVVVVAHYDSGRSQIQSAPLIAPFRGILRTIIRVCIAALVLVTLVAQFPVPEILASLLSILGLIIGIIVLIATIVELINLFMPYNQGANCNASGVAAMMGVAETLTGVRDDGGVDRQRGHRRHDAQVYDEQEPLQRTRKDSSGGARAAGVSGAAGGVFSRAKSLIGKKNSENNDKAHRDEFDHEDYVEPPSKTRIRSGVPVSRGAGPGVSTERANGFGEGLNAPEAGLDAGTGDLGLGAKMAARSRIETGATDNPAIRVRAPLTEQEERSLATAAEAAEAGAAGRPEGVRSADAVPAWFIDAKKAAHKETSSNTSAEKETKVVRSRFADDPVEPKPEAEPGRKTARELELETQQQRSEAPDFASSETVSALSQSAEVARNEFSHPLRNAVKVELEVEKRSVRIVEPPTTLNADFSGIDRLASDSTPLGRTRQPLQKNASPLERASARPIPEAPSNDRLRSLPQMSLGNSGMIPTQQAAFDQKMSFAIEADEETTGTKKVSSTGSFAPLGATGIMKPVGEELLRYSEGEVDLYIEDADEFDAWSGKSSSRDRGGRSAPMMDIPESRTKSFFGNLGDRLTGNRKAKTEDLDSSPSSWLGVKEDFNARTEGSQIGGWDNFSEEDDDDWKGGAYGGGSYEEDAQALQRFSSLLVDKEVWVVALGSHESKNAGIKKLLVEYERDLKSALIINLDGVGVGNLHYTMAEGSFLSKGTDHRLQGLIKSAADALGLDIAPTGLKAYNTDAAEALSLGSRAISLVGLDGQVPAGWRWSTDRLDALEEDNLQAVADIVVEVIKSV